MSRRKQSNPKPIKRSEENGISEVKGILHIPDDDLCLHQLSDHSSSIKARNFMLKGTRYGPYKCYRAEKRLNEDGNLIKLKKNDGVEISFVLIDDMGSWLKFVKQSHNSEEFNSKISLTEDNLLLEILEDLEEGCEIAAVFIDEDSSLEHMNVRDTIIKSEPCSPLANSVHLDMNTAEQQVEKVDEATKQQVCINNKHKSTTLDDSNDQKTFFDHLKEDRTSSCPENDLESKKKQENKATDEVLPNGSDSDTTERYRYVCIPCGIVFSSHSTLMAHQTFYCIHRKKDDQVKTEQNGHISEGEHSCASREEEASESKKRRRESITDDSLDEVSDSKSKKSGQIFSCSYCAYTTDKKSILNRHVRMHSSPPPSAAMQMNKALMDNQMLAAAAMAERQLVLMRSYCAECDIQFTSHKNYSVHKQIYCNTRRVQSRSTATTAGTHVSNAPQSPKTKSTASRSPSASVSPVDSSVSPWNFLPQSALSSSPLILVPCSYVPGRGLIPASNILFQNGEELVPKLNGVNYKNVESFASSTSRVSVVKDDLDAKTDSKISSGQSSPLDAFKRQSKNELSEELQQTDSNEGPLDLSIAKSSLDDDKIEDNEKENFNILKLEAEKGERVTEAPNTSLMDRRADRSKLTDQLSPKINVKSESDESNEAESSSDFQKLTMPVLVKKGVSSCSECNIVFYKHENYLAHKKFYCSVRNKDLTSSSVNSDDEPCRQMPNSENDLENRALKDQSMNISPSPLIQFFCVACGIKFSSIKNLQAHQTYYCPKREAPLYNKCALAAESVNPTGPTTFNCISCKNQYGTELALRKHLCTRLSPKKTEPFSPTVLKSPSPSLVAKSLPEKQSSSLRCIVCGYRGHTLRGMKSHIRSHLSQIDNLSTTLEEEIYNFVLDENNVSIINNNNTVASEDVSSREQTSPEVSDRNSAASDVGYCCEHCSYSSSYRGNVVRHKRLIHKDIMDDDKEHENCKDDVTKTVDKFAGPSSDEKSDEKISILDGKRKNFCNSCRISFSYFPSYMAHKQFYCSNRRNGDGHHLVEEQTAL